MRSLALTIALGAIGLAFAPPVRAASLQVSPVTVELPQPAATASLRLTNSGSKSINAQLRIYRWVQENGEERLVRTRDVVASPPMLSMAPGRAYTVRVVRTAGAAVSAEESYRLLVDEVPPPATRANSVRMAIRHSIPVFFYADGASDPELKCTNAQSQLTCFNAGDRHLRIANLQLKSGVKTISLGKGLNGYVLGRSTKTWRLPARLPGNVTVSAATNRGDLRVKAASK